MRRMSGASRLGCDRNRVRVGLVIAFVPIASPFAPSSSASSSLALASSSTSFVPSFVRHGAGRHGFATKTSGWLARYRTLKLDGADRTGDVWTESEYFVREYVEFVLPHLPLLLYGHEPLTFGTLTLTAKVDTIVVLLYRNPDTFAHHMHMHGHEFVVMDQVDADMELCSVSCLSRNCLATDTAMSTQNAVLEPPRSSQREVGCESGAGLTNPGWWSLHCHIHIHNTVGIAVVIYEPGPAGDVVHELPSGSLICTASPSPPCASVSKITMQCFTRRLSFPTRAALLPAALTRGHRSSALPIMQRNRFSTASLPEVGDTARFSLVCFSGSCGLV